MLIGVIILYVLGGISVFASFVHVVAFCVDIWNGKPDDAQTSPKNFFLFMGIAAVCFIIANLITKGM